MILGYINKIDLTVAPPTPNEDPIKKKCNKHQYHTTSITVILVTLIHKTYFYHNEIGLNRWIKSNSHMKRVGKIEVCRFNLVHTACTETRKGKFQYLDHVQVGRVKWHFCCASVTLCRDSSTLPSAALWNADTAPCSIWPPATPTKTENATCVQSPLVPALLYADGNIHIHGGQ